MRRLGGVVMEHEMTTPQSNCVLRKPNLPAPLTQGSLGCSRTIAANELLNISLSYLHKNRTTLAH